jgi:hypothetical protein
MFPDAFLAHYDLHFGYARQSKFLALIFQPTGLIAGGLFGGLLGQTKATQFLGPALNTTGLSLQCESATLPGYGVNTVDQQVFGSPFSIASGPMPYNPLELQFISAGDLWERKFFEDWLEFIVPKGSIRSTADNFVGQQLINADGASRAAGSASYRNDYISTIQVIQFNDTGIPAARYTFEEAYPVQVAPTPVQWTGGQDDSILRIAVTFKYTTWSREKNIVKQIYDQFKIKK